MVNATIEGVKGTFIFDTGAGINLFFKDFAAKLSEKSTYHFLTAHRATGERLDVPFYKSSTLQFGGTEFKDIPYTTFDVEVKGIDGLLALPMFKNQDFIIDYDNKEITLTDLSNTQNTKSFPIQLNQQADKTLDMVTEITLNDQYNIQVLLDSGSGSGSFWLSDRLIKTLGMKKVELKSFKRKSEFNPDQTTAFYSGKIQSISNKFARLENPKVTFVEGLIYEGKTSIGWLGHKIGISL